MCVLIVLLAGGAEAQRSIASELLVGSFAFLTLGHVSAWDSCAKFKDIYSGGKDLCERMWPPAFVYEPDEDRAFTMWFFDQINPNDAVAKSLGKLENPDTCELQYFHKSVNGTPGDYATGTPGPPSPEADTFTECHPWKENACCHEPTVVTPKAINEAYGPGYHWDRCDEWVDGYKMSDACERFFVQEACMYECDPHAGQYRKFTNPEVAAYDSWSAVDGNPPSGTILESDHPAYQGTYEHSGVVYSASLFRGDGYNAPNKWQMSGMPIKASYCDAFYAACYHDYFCEEGSFWGCNSDWKQAKVERLVAEGAAALSAALAPFPADIIAEVLLNNVTSTNAASFARQLVMERNKSLDDGSNSDDTPTLPNWAIGLIAVLGLVLIGVIAFAAMMATREKSGQPIFHEVKSADLHVKDIKVNSA